MRAGKIRYTCLLLLVFLLTMVSGCYKKTTTPVSNVYTISSVPDITVLQYTDTTVTIPYTILFPAGLHEPVRVTLGDLPPGVTVSNISAVDTSTFTASFTYHIHINAAASFPVALTLFSASFGSRIYTFHIVVNSGIPFSYSITTPSALTIPLYADTVIRVPVTATYIAGHKETITIMHGTLPAGISVSPTSIAGSPTFTDTLAYHIIANTQGSYPLTLMGTSSQGTTTAPVSITVSPGANCAAPLAGNYSGNTVCTSYSGAGTGISPTPVYVSGQDELLITLPFGNVSAAISCGVGTLNSDAVTEGSITIGGGTGTISATTIVLNYSLSGIINSTCKTTLTR